MDFEAFLTLPDSEMAELVRREGPRVVVFPINGTRRWFYLEHGNGDTASGEPGQRGFLDRILSRYIELFELFFNHGVSTLLTPILGPDIAARDPDYLRMVPAALEAITGGERFLDFYDRHDVRVRFYGDYAGYLDQHLPDIPERIRRIQGATADALRHKLFWGMFAHDPIETIARYGIEYHAEYGRAPTRDELVTRYYGEFIPPADVFIGMLPPRVFDYPLLDTGGTALFFTTAPSPYLDREMLRRILFEFINVRPKEEDYALENPETWEILAGFYRDHRRGLTGTGRLAAGGRLWLPD